MTILIIIGVVALAVALVFFLKRSKGAKTANTGAAAADSRALRTTTPKGVTLLSGNPVLFDTQNLIDAALTELFADCAALGYTQNLQHSLYTIEIKEDCVERPDGTMAWLVDAPNYDGSEWDQNPAPGVGQVYCAEMVAMSNGAPTNSYSICRGSDELMRNTVRFGAEHICAFHNSPELYQATLTHSGGNGHPIFQARAK